ncbi:MAG: dTDP-4-dehydrorhamnose 3,5-epimerase [Alphaproteobacteria bacterium]|nr:dTDP-4-dehydrorhamnose 3,5-epimerase [Alphaproteobacteria bacterium]
MIEVRPAEIPDVKLIVPKRHGDQRGFFVETWNRKAFRDGGIDADFCQDNMAFSAAENILRGLHFQTPPHAQTKLVSVLSGRIFDVAVDIRKSSPTFGRHVGVELSAEAGQALLVPKGFAHGYATLVPDTMVFYKVDAHYAPANDAGILWSDPGLAIKWPVSAAAAILSAKDAKLPLLASITSPF